MSLKGLLYGTIFKSTSSGIRLAALFANKADKLNPFATMNDVNSAVADKFTQEFFDGVQNDFTTELGQVDQTKPYIVVRNNDVQRPSTNGVERQFTITDNPNGTSTITFPDSMFASEIMIQYYKK